MPYVDWWNIKNIVWKGKEELPISGKITLDIEGYEIIYEFTFTSIGGVSRIQYEKIFFKNYVTFEREGKTLKIKHDEEFVKNNKKNLFKSLKGNPFFKIKPTLKNFKETIYTTTDDFTNLFFLRRCFAFSSTSKKLSICLGLLPGSEKSLFFALPDTPKKEKDRPSITGRIFHEIYEAIEHIIVVRHPNIRDMKSPTVPKNEDVLSEYCVNLHNILYNWFIEKNGKLPERLEMALSQLFPNIQVKISLSPDGRVYLKIFEEGTELGPPSIPDGLYKILAILTAIELKPTLLAIDELENSLFAEALELIMDELRCCDATVIVTTHSPLIVDMAKLEELIVAEKSSEGTVFKRIKNPEKLREELRSQKLTQSESWLYGAITD